MTLKSVGTGKRHKRADIPAPGAGRAVSRAPWIIAPHGAARQSTRALLRLVAAAALLTSVACADAVAPSVIGAWGGTHVRLDVRHDLTPGLASGGDVEFDCAHGSLMGWIDPDKSGRFDVPGVYVQEHGGPVREGEIVPSHIVRYAGTVNGNRMTLTVTRTDTSWAIGPFDLDRGVSGSVFKCL